MQVKKVKVKITKLGKEKAWGKADIDTMTIHLDPRLIGKKHLLITIHELTHLLNWEFSETKVKEHAKLMTDILWNKLKYRRIDDRNYNKKENI